MSVSSLFQSALAAHRAGRLVEAEQGYRQVLANEKQHADSFHMLAIIQSQKGNLREAEALIRNALAIREDARILVDLALVLQKAGRIPEVESTLRRALCLSPDFVPAQYNLAHFLQDINRLQEAEVAYFRVLETRPDFAPAYFNLGRLFERFVRHAEAEQAYRHSLILKPDFPEAQHKLHGLLASPERSTAEQIDRSTIAIAIFQSANYLWQARKLTEAEKSYRQILTFDRDNVLAFNFLAMILLERNATAEAEELIRRALTIRNDSASLVNLGNLLMQTARTQDAEASYRRALQLDSTCVLAHYNLGNLLREAQRYPEAEVAYRNAIVANPDGVEAQNNLGLLFQETGRYSEAEIAYRSVIDRNPHFAAAHVNLGNLYSRVRRLHEAELSYRKALEINPSLTEANINLGHILLAQGRYSEAWPFHEWRNDPNSKDRTVNLPFRQWRGEPLAGKSFTIWPEQGFGDIIQFVRYVPLLKELGVSRLILVCPPPLKPLLETVQGVGEVVTEVGPAIQTDFWSYSMTLAMHFNTTLHNIPSHLPYLYAPAEKVTQWRTHLQMANEFKVGLVWKGNPSHRHDSHRSLPALSLLSPLWDVPSILFISLQKGAGEEEALQSRANMPIIPLGSDIRDFGDTAAIVAQLDLVICVDTAIAHVAGALGKPCWVLLPAFGTDWRWLVDQTDSPWYPGCMRLFRQKVGSDWEETVREVVIALKYFISGKSTNQLSSTLPFSVTSINSEDNPNSATVQLHDFPVLTEGKESQISLGAESAPELFQFARQCQQAGRFEEAENILRQILGIDESNADAYDMLGVIQFLRGRVQDAEFFIRKALAIREEADFLTHLGNILLHSARTEQAKEVYARALRIKPDHVLALYHLGTLFLETKRLPEAEAALRAALAANSDFAEGYINLGLVLQEGKRWPEAEFIYRRALSFRSDLIEAHVNLGLVLQKSNRLAEAEASFRQALVLNSNSPEANANLGRLLLALGRYAEAWPHHEYCFDPHIKNNIDTISDIPFERWRGEDLTGKSLLIWPEHGFGDYIQFVRYVAMFKSRGVTHLTLACTPPLKALLETIEGVEVVIADIATIVPHDYWSFPWSLPRHFNTTLKTIPAALPYLNAPTNRLSKWKNRIPQSRLKVGLGWKDKYDSHRALPGLNTLAPLWAVQGVTFFSLQKGKGEDDALHAPIAQPIVPLGSEIMDFADTAAIVAQLDLVICIDSAIAHVVGALGKPCWVLLPFLADYRWLLDRSDSPWYPGVMHLFRNTDPDDWTNTIEEVVVALENWVKARDPDENHSFRM